jgi:hypothetical protein
VIDGATYAVLGDVRSGLTRRCGREPLTTGPTSVNSISANLTVIDGTVLPMSTRPREASAFHHRADTRGRGRLSWIHAPVPPRGWHRWGRVEDLGSGQLPDDRALRL